MWVYYNKAVVWLDRLTMWEWFVLLLAALMVGIVCLKGFGSRKGY